MRHPNRMLLLMVPVLAACHNLAPALSSALVAFGQDLLSSAAFNYRPQYAESVSNLLLAMAQTTTGLEFTDLPQDYYAVRRQHIDAQRRQDAYQQPAPYSQPSYGQPPGYGQPQTAHDQSAYGQQGYDDGSYGQDSYQEAGTTEQYAGGSASSYGYASQEPGTGYGQEPQVEAYDYPASTSSDGYATVRSASGSAAPGSQPNALDVALLAHTRLADGRVGLEEVADGDTLHDGGADPAAGDRIKLSFRASCRCYLYVIGIDATGWVTRIHPSPGAPAVPLEAEKDYLLPAGDTWWGLDEYKGVEQIYFVLSPQRRSDIEQALAALPVERPAVPAGYRGVQEPAVVPVRGLVKVQSPGPTQVATSTGIQPATPVSFASSLADGDVVVTRWFNHR